MSLFRVESEIAEGSDFYLVGAISVAVSGQEEEVLITTSDVNGTITLDIFEAGSATAIYSANLVTGTVIFNTPQLDAFWKDMDDIGYNCRVAVREADVGVGVLKGGRRYTCILRIPTFNDGTLRAVFIPSVVPLHA